jgi:hypothetical protein
VSSVQQKSDVYALKIFNYKLYVVNARRLVPLVQRLSKTLSFTPFQRFAQKVLVDTSDYALDIHNNPDFMRDFDTITRMSLSPGSHLDYQNLRTIESLNKCLDKFLIANTEPKQVAFYKWSRHIVAIAASDGLYGKSNPFHDQQLEDAFW